MTVPSSFVRTERTLNSHRLPNSAGRKVGLGVAALAAVLLAAGCKPATTGTPVPNVVGMHGDKAKDALQKPDAYIARDVTFQDVKAGETSPRIVIIKSNWKVCGQAPAAGSPSVKDLTVKLYVVKNEENCPGISPRPSMSTSAPTAVPSAQTTATPTPNTAPSTQVPAPEATTNPPANTYSPPPAPAAGPTPPAPSPAGSCKAHTVGYCGWDRGETPQQPGETATCKDGYVSFAGDDGSGTCSGHKGVRVWFK
ncbi:DUF3761 domain-containing protein [Kitasatospora acidiphila]|uniref:DUF3761 domain-containing protein n=1 Tax=Kitasatospora acidiphila TaxID=2567942 RepID=A0A540VXV4_9ACTN|nr:DUF3761 domain-containing protein [Kitasatospora acidiphila]